jgi:hypothetical protein
MQRGRCSYTPFSLSVLHCQVQLVGFFVLTDYLLVSAETVALAEGGTSSGSVVRQQPWLAERQQHLVRLIFLLLGKVHICNNSPTLQTDWWQQ